MYETMLNRLSLSVFRNGLLFIIGIALRIIIVCCSPRSEVIEVMRAIS